MMRWTLVLAIIPACSRGAPTPETSATRARIVAHRGASVDAPENTMAAFRRAWELGAEAIELDVRLSRDGAVVVIHDEDTRRTAGVDKLVSEQTLAELRALDAGSWRGPTFRGERIPTLAEVLAALPPGRTVHVEIKSGADTAPAVGRVIQEANVEARGAHVALQSYDAPALAALDAATEGAPAFWDVDPPLGPDRQPQPYPLSVIEDAVAHRFAGLALDVRGVTDELLAAARRANVAMDVWTVNDSAGIDSWLGRDVRWIETDRPDLARVSSGQRSR